MRRLVLVLAAAALSGCAHYTMQPAPAWPAQMTIREHASVLRCWELASPARKAAHVLLLAPPAGCAWVNLCQRTCDIYYPAHARPCPDGDLGCLAAEAAREHELAHCRGMVHGDAMDDAHYRYWTEGRCETPAQQAPVIATETP